MKNEKDRLFLVCDATGDLTGVSTIIHAANKEEATNKIIKKLVEKGSHWLKSPTPDRIEEISRQLTDITPKKGSGIFCPYCFSEMVFIPNIGAQFAEPSTILPGEFLVGKSYKVRLKDKDGFIHGIFTCVDESCKERYYKSRFGYCINVTIRDTSRKRTIS